MKKNILVFSAICFFTLQSMGQFPYATIWSAYPVPYSLSAGFATTNTPGFFWLGYNSTVLNIPGTWHSNKNFCIMGTGPSSIWSTYKIYDGATSCEDTLSQVLNGLGVSAIETNGPNNLRYALAGTYDKGCFFATLDFFGNVLSTQFFPFPHVAGTKYSSPSKPIIIENPGTNEYFICGSFESDMYVIKISSTGFVYWSSFYSLGYGIHPNDITISANNSNDLIIVGKVERTLGNIDAFFMELKGSSGGINFTRMYGDLSNTDQFNTISFASYINPTNGGGYVIGGYTKLASTPVPGEAWVLKLDQAGNMIWSRTIKPTLGTNSGIVDIIERQNLNNNFEYYGVLASSVGMQVVKLNDSGNPFPTSFPNAQYNEFVYNMPSAAPAVPTSISYVNGTGLNPNIGFQVYGTATNFPGFTSSYAVSAYFNGETNCSRTLTTIHHVAPGPEKAEEFPTAAKYGEMNVCKNFQILAFFPGGSLNFPCSGLMLTGNNQRGVATELSNEIIPNEDFNVYPNPVSDKAIVNYTSGDDNKVKIEVYNMLGQSVKMIEPDSKTAGSYKEEVDFKSLNLESGVYFVTATINKTTHKQKIVYNK